MVCEMIDPVKLGRPPARRSQSQKCPLDISKVPAIIIVGYLAICCLVQSVESLQIPSQGAMKSAQNNSSPKNRLGPYSDEVDNLFTELTTISESLFSGSKQADANNDISESSRTVVVSPSAGSIKADTNSNASTNDTQPQYGIDSLIVGTITAEILIFIVGFCGNSLVILVILKFTRTESVTDIYILNLAFADIMFLFGLVFLITTMFIDHWVFGELMCKLYMSVTSLNQFASSLLLVVMSADRYLAVCHPIYAQRFRQLNRAKLICLCIWIICLILMTPILLFARMIEAKTIDAGAIEAKTIDAGTTEARTSEAGTTEARTSEAGTTEAGASEAKTCAIMWPEFQHVNLEMVFTTYSFIIGFVCPIVLITVLNKSIVRKLRITGPASLASARRSKGREDTTRRIKNLIKWIISTYGICWLPYWISQLCLSFLSSLFKDPVQGFYAFVLVATCLSYTNSAVNPILYAFLSDNFKRRCSNVFRPIAPFKWCIQRSPATDAHTTVATALCEPSECIEHGSAKRNGKGNTDDAHHARPGSRQTVVIDESVRMITSPDQLNGILTTTLSVSTADHRHDGTHGQVSQVSEAKSKHRNERAASHDAEDEELDRRQMIGSSLSQLHSSMSCEDYPTAASGHHGGDCFSSARSHSNGGATEVICFGCLNGNGPSNEATRKGSSGGGSKSEAAGRDSAIREGGSREMSISRASLGAHCGEGRSRSIAFSVDMIIVQGPGSKREQMVGGDRGPERQDSQHRRHQHCQDAV